MALVVAAGLLAPACSSTSTPAGDADSTPSGAASTETTSTTVEGPPGSAALADGVWLLSDGLGIVAFGDSEESAMPRLIEALGRQPTADTSFTADMPDGLGGADTTVRLVDFGPLSVTFTDWPYYRDDGVMHFARWMLFQGPDQPGLSTSEGISIGSTIEQLRSAYGERLNLDDAIDDCTGDWRFTLDSSTLGLQGALDGSPTEGSSSVILLTAGAQSSC